MIQQTVSIGLVDDHTIFRKAMADYLGNQPHIEVAVQVSSLEELLDNLKNKHIDVLITDLYMPGINAVDIVKKIMSWNAGFRILFLSMCTDPKIISMLLEEGIHGYISKADEPEELLKAIHSAYDNRIFRNHLFTEALYWNTEQNRLDHTELDEREKQIIRLLWQEKTNKEIAEEIFLGIRSIEKIRQNLKTRLAVRSTVGIFKYAIRTGIIQMPGSSDQPPDLKKRDHKQAKR